MFARADFGFLGVFRREDAVIKVDQNTLDKMERNYPGIGQNIRHYDETVLPACLQCGSEDTATVSCGIIGRSIHVAAATTKIKLLANGPKPGQYFCHACQAFFG
jgi:hypothetical protein